MRPTDKARLLRELSERAARLAGLHAETDYLVDPKLSLLDTSRIAAGRGGLLLNELAFLAGIATLHS